MLLVGIAELAPLRAQHDRQLLTGDVRQIAVAVELNVVVVVRVGRVRQGVTRDDGRMQQQPLTPTRSSASSARWMGVRRLGATCGRRVGPGSGRLSTRGGTLASPASRWSTEDSRRRISACRVALRSTPRPGSLSSNGSSPEIPDRWLEATSLPSAPAPPNLTELAYGSKPADVTTRLTEPEVPTQPSQDHHEHPEHHVTRSTQAAPPEKTAETKRVSCHTRGAEKSARRDVDSGHRSGRWRPPPRHRMAPLPPAHPRRRVTTRLLGQTANSGEARWLRVTSLRSWPPQRSRS